jgi:hypothetical protein
MCAKDLYMNIQVLHGDCEITLQDLKAILEIQDLRGRKEIKVIKVIASMFYQR